MSGGARAKRRGPLAESMTEPTVRTEDRRLCTLAQITTRALSQCDQLQTLFIAWNGRYTASSIVRDAEIALLKANSRPAHDQRVRTCWPSRAGAALQYGVNHGHGQSGVTRR